MLKELLLYMNMIEIPKSRENKQIFQKKISKNVYKPYQCQRMLWIYQSFPQIQIFK